MFRRSKTIACVAKRRNFELFSQSCHSVPGRTKDEEVKGQRSSLYFNPCHIQMISDELYSQIFKGVSRQKTHSEGLVDKVKRHLHSHGLWGQKVDVQNPVAFQLPELDGNNIDEHFISIATKQSLKYNELLNSITKLELPEFPKKWEFSVGWTKYFKDGTSSSVPFPEENALIFDVEVCVPHGLVPTLACALSSDGWYSWCSLSLVTGVDRDPEAKVRLEELIPLETFENQFKPPSGSWTEKIVIGHNVSYDRARIKEQYFLEKTKLRFFDTMSLHIAISGITSYQRALKVTMDSRMKPGTDVSSWEWNELSSLNNLVDVHKLYCKGADAISKDDRNIFVKGTLDDVRNNFQSLASYCAKDVKATHEVFQTLLPVFHERFPHPVTLSGMLEMGTSVLPINENWIKYKENSEQAFRDSEKEVKAILMQKANEALNLLEGEKYKEDPWLWDLDWKVTKPRVTKNSPKNDNQPLYPAWYKKLMYKVGTPEYQPGPAKIGSSMQVVPKLLRLTWFGFPLHHSKVGKWGFLIKNASNLGSMPNMHEEELADYDFPYKHWEEIFEDSKRKLLNGVSTTSKTNLLTVKTELISKPEDAVQDLSDFLKGLEKITGRSYRVDYPDPYFGQRNSPHPLCEFVPLPHKDGANYRVGNPLSKDFLSKIEEGILSCQNGQDIADKVVTISKKASYWRNSRDRIFNQMTVWYKDEKGQEIGTIVPQVIVAGTLTRRAVESTWMTASNAYEDRIGSELKGMIQTPPSYYFVGADVDSQELWIASALGDAHFTSQHGSTAIGWMTLQGTKNAGTDMHSKTAAMSGILRDQAKILNYARIYGAGVKFAERLLLQFNRNMSPKEARQKANAMYQMTKGDRKYLLNEEGRELASDLIDQNRLTKPISKAQLRLIMSHNNISFRDYMTLVERLVWDNGTESYMFNRLEEIAQQEKPQTPILGGLISRSLVPSAVQDDYMTSRVNWVVQSSAVDYLHLMLTCMNWIILKFDIKARFVISIHDEVRYMVHEEDRYRLALALQITNLLTRSFCSYHLGMHDLPQSVAFFSCVDIDKALRKEVTHDCVTPSNPHGLRKTYNIPEGEALDIWKILELTNGTLLKS